MPQDILLRRQRAELANLIREHRFHGSEFVEGPWRASEVGFDGSDDVYAIVLGSWSAYAFALRAADNGGRYAVAMHPGKVSHRDHWDSQTWPQVLSLFGDWLKAVRLERELPDAWSKLASFAFTEATSAPTDNSTFTEQEQRYLHRQLDRILGAVQFTQDQLTVVTADLDYLKESAARSGRRDWGLMLLGNLLSWLGSSVLSPQEASTLLQHHLLPILKGLHQGLLPS